MKFGRNSKSARTNQEQTFTKHGITNKQGEQNMTKIAPAFINAKKAFSPALKDKTNPAFRSKYADLGACLEAVNDALLDNGIAIMQETSEDETGVTVETVLLHESGETIRSGRLHVPAVKHDPQGFGSALTYARRYSLMAVCGIAPEDDDGNAASRQPVKREEPAKDFSAEMAKLRACGSIYSLSIAWSKLDKQTQHALASVKDECKNSILKANQETAEA